MYKKGNKIVASLIVFIMMLVNFSPIATVIAAEGVNAQNSKTNNRNVEFDSYFVEEQAATREAVKVIGGENTLVAHVAVSNAGYLKDAKVEFVDANFKIAEEIASDAISKVEGNTVYLNQVNAGESIPVEIPFSFEHGSIVNVDIFDKESTVKLTATYVNEEGKENAIEKEIKVNVKWTASVEEEVSAEITKYVPYDVNGQKGVVLQAIIKDAIKNDIVPLRSNVIEVAVPQINGVAPIDVVVTSDRGNYSYEANDDKTTLKITFGNVAGENGIVNWLTGSTEYVVDFIYPETAVTSDTVNMLLDVKTDAKVYGYALSDITSNLNQEIVLEGKLGEIVDFNIAATPKVSKGYMYANFDRQEKLETPYNEKVTLNISNPEIVDGILINMDRDVFDNGNANASYYKSIKISKAVVNEFFGEEGFIRVYKNGEVIASINKDTEEEVTTVEVNADEFKLETSKPVRAGKVAFEFEKAIKADTGVSKEELAQINNVRMLTNVQMANSDIYVAEKSANKEMPLEEPVLKADLVVSNTNLSTIVNNENIEIRTVLRTDSEYDKLFKDPIVVIDLPEYVEKINIKDVQLLFDEELKIKNTRLEGRRLIVELEGTQTNYSVGSPYGGASIEITADLSLSQLTPNKQDSMKVYVISNNEQIEMAIPVTYMTPTGVVTVNKVSNYEEGQQVTALLEDESVELKVQSGARNATEEIHIINNYDNKIENVYILGRTLTEGTTNSETGEALNNTLNAPMISGIDVHGKENVDVYYSNNGQATTDLNDAANGWTTAPANVAEVKSYLIVMDDEAMNPGDSATFTYNMQIPENLDYDKEATSLYTVYFDNVQEEQVIKDRTTSRRVTFATEAIPDLQVTLSSYSEENSIIRNGQYVRMIATIKNTGEVDAKNVKLNVEAPVGTGYIFQHAAYQNSGASVGYEGNEDSLTGEGNLSTKAEYVTSDELIRVIDVGTVKAGKEIKVEYDLLAGFTTENIEVEEAEDDEPAEDEPIDEEPAVYDTKSVHKVTVTADDMENPVESNEYKLEVGDGNVQLLMLHDLSDNEPASIGKSFAYSLYYKLLEEDAATRDNKIVIHIPKGLKITNAGYMKGHYLEEEVFSNSGKINETDNTVTFDVAEIDEENVFVVAVDIVNPEITDTNSYITAYATATTGNREYHSNIMRKKVEKVDISFVQEQPDKLYVREEEEITFKYKVKNNATASSNLSISSIIPDGLMLTDVVLIKDGEEMALSVGQTNDWSDDIMIDGKEEFALEFTATAEELDEGVQEKEVTVFAKLATLGTNDIETNKVTITIEGNPDIVPIDEIDSVGGTRIISGVAWLDEDNNGQRDGTEQLISGMEVRLLNKNTNAEVAKTTTSNAGTYSFRNLDNGEYLVVFLYDSATYGLTQYRKSGISESVNSDVVAVDMTIDGSSRRVAMSDAIKIEDNNARNIDIGLSKTKKAAVKLDKYISAITVSYSGTTKKYNYENEKIAKVEIPANNMANASVVIEYKIVVTNQGEVSNYVKKVVDYLPKDMRFSSELNRDWYQSTNGDIYNSSLANTKLAPGESKTLTLTVTKQMTSNNTGIVNNTAEVFEAYNEEGIVMTATPGNKVSGEIDMSSADVVIGVKTGNTTLNVLIIVLLLLIVAGTGTFITKKTILKKEDEIEDIKGVY